MAPSFDLASPTKLTRWIVLQKARRHIANKARNLSVYWFARLRRDSVVSFVRYAPTPCRHWVSGSISLPSRGSFHLSITVLVRYRSFAIFSLGRWSCRIQTGFLVPRPTCEYTYKFKSCFRILGFHHLWRAIQTLPLTTMNLIRSVNAVGFYAERSSKLNCSA